MPADRLAERLLFWRSPQRHLYGVALAIVFTVWVVELEVFNLAASNHRCPWPTARASGSVGPTRRAPAQATVSRKGKQVDHSLHILLLADPQILWTHAYPRLNRLLKPLPPWLADHYIRKAYRALLRTWDTDDAARVDAIIWVGDLTDEGRRTMSNQEWLQMHEHLDRLFPPKYSRRRDYERKRRMISSTSSVPSASSASTIPQILRPRPERLPIFYVAGNHDVPIPRQEGETWGIEADRDARQRFTQRYGTHVVADGHRRFYAIDGEGGAGVMRSLNARVLVAAGAEKEGGGDPNPTHELVLLDAMDLIGMERDPLPNLSKPPGTFELLVESKARKAFPQTFAFVESLGKSVASDPFGNSSRSDQLKNGSTRPLPRAIVSHVPLWRPLPRTTGASSSLLGEDLCDVSTHTATHGIHREHKSGGLKQGTDRYDTYQNLISPRVSDWVLRMVGWTGGAVFSGDDHDHCEYAHAIPSSATSEHTTVEGFSVGQLPELTLKSMSMTMGVRKPGFARLTLFAPPASSSRTGPESWQQGAETMGYTPCLLPDRIGLSIMAYPLLVLVSFAALLHRHATRSSPIRSSGNGTRRRASDEYELLPNASEAGIDEEQQEAQRSKSSRLRRRPGGKMKAFLVELAMLFAFGFVVFYVAVALA